MSTGLVSSEASLLGLYMAILSLCLHLVRICVLISSFYKDTNHIALGSTYVTSFLLKYLFKDLIFKYSHILSYWRLGIQHMNLWGGENSAHSTLPPESPKFMSLPHACYIHPISTATKVLTHSNMNSKFKVSSKSNMERFQV